jgi:glycosyltransferase involved in cell wall biosynthesis
MKILITGTTGASMPPPYGGVPKLSLLCAGVWKKLGNSVGITFVYRPQNADDLNSGAEYFFEYSSKPNKFKKLLFLVKYFFSNPILYVKLMSDYIKICPKISMETILYSAYGIYIDRVINKFKPDIVLSEAALIQTFMVAKVTNKRNIPVVFDTYAEIHDLSMGVNKNLNDFQRHNYWKTFLKLADLVIAPGPYCCRGPLVYLPKEKVEFVYDGSDYSLCKIDIAENKELLREQMRLPKDQFLIGNVGAFEARKGQDHLIKAISKLSKQGYNIGAVICGGAGDPTKWKNLAKEEGVEDKVHLVGRLKEIELAKIYKSLDVFSDLENTPRACGLTMSILEGMAMGLPVVIFNNRELFEVVKENENGFSVPIDDTDALAETILKMHKLSSEVRKEMGEKAAISAKRIDINFTANGKMELFKKVLGNIKK